MLNFVGLIGTNSKESNNRRLLQFMQKHFADKASIELVEIDNIPLFNKPAKMKVPEVVSELAKKIEAADGVIVSVDTLHASTAREAARVGAAIINDVSGGRWDPEMNAAVAQSGCAYVVQHYRALPGMPGEHFDYGDDLVGTLIERVGSQVQDAIDAGVTADKIVVDPGLGFSLTGDQCWQILRELRRFLQGGYPVLVGASRKRFVKALEGDVDVNSADIAAYCAAAGAWAVRVHDVAATVAAIARKENDVD